MGVASFKGDAAIPELTVQDINNWESPEFEIDYVRVYESDPDNFIDNFSDNMSDKSTIVIITMAFFLVVAFVKMHKQKRKIEQVKNDELYDDNFEKFEESRFSKSYTTEQVYDHIYDQTYVQVNIQSQYENLGEPEYLEMTQRK